LDPAQLIDSIGPGPLATSHGMAGQVNHNRPATGLAQREAALLAALGAGACLDHLCERLRQPPAQLSERLLRLELAGLVRGEPGLWWRPSTPGL
jgi:predicted Rossmann fold nucleotide-binding protein DprA/Smf involved in DNA uptake